MAVVICKNYALAYSLATLHLQTVLHQVLNYGINGINIVDVTEYLIVVDVSYILCFAIFSTILSRLHRVIIKSLASLLILPDFLHLLLLVLVQTAILDTLLQYHRTTLETCIVHQVAIGNSIFQFIGIVGRTLLHLKDVVCALVHLITWCSGKSNEHCIEVVEDCSVLAEYTSVGFINDNQVEPTNRERLFLCINEINHCLVCREGNASIQITFTALVQHTSSLVW